jgi:hypothetical protein
MWVYRRAHSSGAGSGHGHVDGMVLGELCVVSVELSPSSWRPSIGVGDREDMSRGNLAWDFAGPWRWRL